MAQLQKGTTYTAAGGGNDLVTYSNLNAHVDSAILLPGAITSQTPLTTTAAGDRVLVSDTSAANALVAVELSNLVPAGTLTSTQEAEANRQSVHQYAAGTLSASVYAVTLSPAATAYTAGMVVRFKADSANAGAVDINVNALGAKNLFYNVSEELGANFIRASQIVTAIYDGTNFQVISLPWKNYLTGDQFMSSGTAIPNALLPTGALTQQVASTELDLVTTTASIPIDNSIPQNGEGTELTDLATTITPRSASNILEIEVYLPVTNGVAGTQIAALFQDSTADALAVADITVAAGYAGILILRHRMVAGTTSATTFKVRVGCNNGTLTINGASGVRKYGGISAARVFIKEMAAS